MAQARDEAGNIWEVDAQGNPVRLVQAANAAPQMPADPTFQYQGPKAQADIANTTNTIADRNADNARADEELRLRRAADAREQAKFNAEFNPDGTPKGKPDPVQSALDGMAELDRLIAKIDNIRTDARDNGGLGETGFTGSWLGGIPGTAGYGLRADLKTLDASAAFKALQKMRDESPTGGALGQITEKELDLLKSTVANLDPDQSQGDFLARLAEARKYYEDMRGRIAREVPPERLPKEDRQDDPLAAMRPPAGGNNSTPPGFAGGGDSEKSIPIPPAMQQEHAAFLAQNWGRIDPEAYAQFRAGLDQKYGFEPRPDAYRAIVPQLNQRAQQGGSPEGLNIPPVNAKMDGLDSLNASLFNNRLGGLAFGIGDQLGLADEMAGGVRSLINGTDYDVEVARANAMKNAMQDAYGTENLIGNVGGALLTGAGAAKAFPALTSALTKNGLRSIGTGAAFGALTGAGEMNDSRGTGALVGGGLGIAGGAAGVAASPVLRSAMDSRIGQAASRGGRSVWNNTLGRVPGLPAVADAPVVPRMAKGEGLLPADVLESAIPNLQDADNLGLPYALGDANPKLRMLAGSVSRRSADARQMAEDIFEPRAFGQADRATEAIDQHLAPQTDIAARRNELFDAGNSAAEPFYRMAEDVRTPVDPQLQALLRSSTGQDALGRAKQIMSDRLLPDTDKRIFFGPDNLLTVEHTPAFQTLDYVKKGVDARLNEAKNPVTGNLDLRGNPQLQAIEGWRKSFVGALDNINPDYATARATYAPYAQRAEALDRGYAAPATNIRPRDLRSAIDGLTPEQLPEYQRGFATKLIDDTNATRFSGNPYNRIAGSPQQQEKLGMVFPEGATTFQRIAALEKDMAKTAHETLGGSPTAARQAIDEQFDNGLMGVGTNLAADAMGGGGAFTLKSALGKGAQFLADTARLKGGKAKADAIAPVLFDPNPGTTLNYVADLAERQRLAAERARSFARRSGLFGAVAPLSFLGSE